MKSQNKTKTTDNNINTITSIKIIPQKYKINNFLTNTNN